MAKYNTSEIAAATECLQQYLKPTAFVRNEKTNVHLYAANRQNVFMIVKHVAASGMSREISVYVCVDGDLVGLTDAVAIVAGLPVGSHDGVRIGGCGMDMGFALLDAAVHKAFPGQDVSANDFIIRYL